MWHVEGKFRKRKREWNERKAKRKESLERDRKVTVHFSVPIISLLSVGVRVMVEVGLG